MKTPLKQNVQIFSRIWRMMYTFITVKRATRPLKTATRKEFSVRANYLACQTHVVEKNMKIGYKSTENLRSKIHEKKSRMVNGIWEVKIGKVEDLHLYGPHVYS